jgi:hypothetical protein
LYLRRELEGISGRVSYLIFRRVIFLIRGVRWYAAQQWVYCTTPWW